MDRSHLYTLLTSYLLLLVFSGCTQTKPTLLEKVTFSQVTVRNSDFIKPDSLVLTAIIQRDIAINIFNAYEVKYDEKYRMHKKEFRVFKYGIASLGSIGALSPTLKIHKNLGIGDAIIPAISGAISAVLVAGLAATSVENEAGGYRICKNYFRDKAGEILILWSTPNLTALFHSAPTAEERVKNWNLFKKHLDDAFLGLPDGCI